MTREETIKVMSVLRGAYPRFYREISKQEALDTINLWADMFSAEDAAVVAAAVKSLIETDEKGFPPTIGQVKAKVRDVALPVRYLTGRTEPGENYRRMLGYLEQSRKLLAEVQKCRND